MALIGRISSRDLILQIWPTALMDEIAPVIWFYKYVAPTALMVELFLMIYFYKYVAPMALMMRLLP